MNNPRVGKLVRKLNDVGLCEKLDGAGLGTPGKIRRAKDKAIKAIPGIGQAGLKKIREVFPEA
jgi:hypothetical protein